MKKSQAEMQESTDTNNTEQISETAQERYRKHILMMVISAVLFVLLAIYVHAGVTLGFEGWIYSKSVALMSPTLTSIIKGITHVGDTVVVIAFCLTLIAVPKTRKTIALPVSTAVVLSALLNMVLKNLFARERPDILRLLNETSYSFPSGHAMINGTLYTILIIMIFKFIKSRPRRLMLSIPCALMAMAIGFSRIYLGVHYAGDILGGWTIGFTMAILVYALWKKFVFHERLMQMHIRI
jgi:undecaprenyl-diphosphatase